MKKATSRAELKILQLELWLEPARLGLITNTQWLESQNQPLFQKLNMTPFQILAAVKKCHFGNHSEWAWMAVLCHYWP
jgi:hypothetical protein